MIADIAGAERAEDRIGDRVEHDIGVAMAGEALVVRDLARRRATAPLRRRRHGRRSRSRPGASSRRASARREIRLVGQFLQGRIAFDHRHRQARRAGDLRIVGRLAAGPLPRGRGRSRRSGRPAGSARGRGRRAARLRRRSRASVSVTGKVGTAPSCVSSAPSSRSITAPRQEGAGGVVDEHALGTRRSRGEAVRHRLPPGRAADDGAGRGRSPIAAR